MSRRRRHFPVTSIAAPTPWRCAICRLSTVAGDGAAAVTQRIVWPFALGYFDSARVVAAWCELRGAYRHFRTDRIQRVEMLETRYPRRRALMLAQWRQAEGVPAP